MSDDSDPWNGSELVWFIGVTTGLHTAIVSIMGSALVLIERYGFFQEAKIQSQVRILTVSDEKTRM